MSDAYLFAGGGWRLISIVEPQTADCVYRTAEKDDGKLHNAPGSLETIMAGLSCGEPCSVGWKEIRAAASHYFRIEESVAADGVRVLWEGAFAEKV